MEIIAEIGQNHNGDMALAKELVVAAKENGADVAKFQLFDAKALFSPDNNPWYEYNLSTELSFEQAEELAAYCDENDIEFMASAFDPERVDWLEKLGVKRHKIASRVLNDPETLAAYSKTGKPLLFSLGFYKGEGFPVLETSGPLSFLHCIAEYPTPLEHVGLAKVDFRVFGGFSDHTEGISAAVAAFARGAAVVEKHFTLDKTMYGPDHAGSMTPAELAQLSAFRDDFARLI